MKKKPCILCEGGEVTTQIICRQCRKQDQEKAEINNALTAAFDKQLTRFNYETLSKMSRFVKTKIKEYVDFT